MSDTLLMRACVPIGAAAAAWLALAAQADTPGLVAAVEHGNRAAALDLLSAGADASAPAPDGTTALHWAARADDVELARRLLDAGADASISNRYSITPAYLAALNGSAAMLELLLDAGASASAATTEGETLLMTVARTGAVDAADVLLARGADVDAREHWHGQTALMWAAAQCHAPMAERLLERGADVDARSNVEEWARQVTAEPRAKWLPRGGLTPLMFAAREGCVDAARVLAAAGADVDAATPEGFTALISALINGHYDAAAVLIEAGADPNLVDEDGRGALYAAVDFNTMPKSNRPAPDVIHDEHTALDIARMLLEAGADPNVRLDDQAPYRAKLDRGNDTVLNRGTTPLLRAAKSGDVAAIELLLEHDADPFIATERGVTPLMVAAGVGTTEQDTTGRFKTEARAIAAIDLLLAQGLDVNAVDSRGRTALHGAALQGFDEIVAALVERGAALDVEDEEGFTPLETALGLAGGWGFSGEASVVQESTVALLERLLSQREP